MSRERQAAHRLALALGLPDVDAMLEAMTWDAFQDWQAYLDRNLPAWEGLRLAVRRLGFLIVQTHSRRKLRERDFDIDLSRAGPPSPALERARLSAAAIRSQTASRTHG